MQQRSTPQTPEEAQPQHPGEAQTVMTEAIKPHPSENDLLFSVKNTH